MWPSLVASLEGKSGFPGSLSSALGCIRPHKQQPTLIQGSSLGSFILDDDLSGPKLPLRGNNERKPSSCKKQRKPQRVGQMLSAKTLMQQKQSSLTEQAKSVSYCGREMTPRVSPAKNSTPQEAQGRKMLGCYPCQLRWHLPSRKQGFSTELDETHRARVPWKLDAKACTNSRERGGQGEFGGTGRAVGATGELELREGSQSLHHSGTSGIV